MLHRLEVLVVLPDLVNGVSLFLTWWILAKDVARRETRMRRPNNVDQHGVSVRTVLQQMFRRMIVGDGARLLEEGSKACRPCVMKDFVVRRQVVGGIPSVLDSKHTIAFA